MYIPEELLQALKSGTMASMLGDGAGMTEVDLGMLDLPSGRLVAADPLFIIVGTLFTNASYGIMLPTMREITEDTVPDELKNTARSLTDAVFGNFAGILALLYSGWMMDSFGAKSVAWLGLCVMVIPVVMSLMKMRKKN